MVEAVAEVKAMAEVEVAVVDRPSRGGKGILGVAGERRATSSASSARDTGTMPIGVLERRRRKRIM